MCDYCGAAYYRSDLAMDGAGRLRCSQHRGLSAVELNELNAAAAEARVEPEFERDGGAGWEPVELNIVEPALDSFEVDHTLVDGSIIELAALRFTWNKPMGSGVGTVRLYTTENVLVQAWEAREVEHEAVGLVTESVATVTEAYSTGAHYVVIDPGTFVDAQKVPFEGVSDREQLTFEVS